LYHNGQIHQGSASYSGPTVTVAGQNIVTTPNADVALMVATNLNNSFVKAAGPAKGKQAAKPNKKKASKK
jgi:peptidase, M48 family